MPEISGTGDNWYISHHQERYVEVLEAVLPSNRRIRLEYIDGGDDVVLKTLVVREDLTEKWEVIADLRREDLDGIASLFFKASDMIEGEGGWHPWRWLWCKISGKKRRRGGDDGIDEDGEDSFGLGSAGVEQGRGGIPADAGGGGGDPRDERAPSGDGPKAP